MRRAIQLLLGMAILAVCVGIGVRYFTSEETRIRRALAELAGSLRVPPNEAPLARLGAARKFQGLFAPDVGVVLAGVPSEFREIQGRDQLFELYLTARGLVNECRVEFRGIRVTVGPDQSSAHAELTVLGEVDGDPNAVAQDVRIDLVRSGRDWLIRRVRTLRNYDRARSG